MNTYKDFLNRLDRLHETVVKLGLDQMTEACERTGHPEKQFKSVHIAGTNGKGSVAATLESIIRHNGYMVGLYTSPHLTDVRERIQIDRIPIPKGDVARLSAKLDGIARLSYFEHLTMIAFLYFAEQKVDIAVIETGLGGRLDATNVINPLVTVLTPISMDHTACLGEDILSIAGEKCGIIKKGIKVISSRQEDGVSALIKRRCAEAGAELITVDAALHSSLPGRHQMENAAVAVAAAGELGGMGYRTNIRDEYLDVDWPGRLQKISNAPEIIVDGAHNTAACRALAAHLKEHYSGRDIVFAFSAMKDKDIGGMIDILKGLASGWVFFQLDGPRAASMRDFEGATGRKGVHVTDDVGEAIKHCESFSFKNPLIVVTGSLYLVGRFLVFTKEDAYFSI